MNGEKEKAYFFPLEENPDLEQEYILSDNVVTIGRHPENSISILDEAISRRHAKIEKRGDEFIILDLNSSNGTFVNGEMAHSRKLCEGDIITMGDIDFGFSYKSKEEREEEPDEDSTVSFVPDDPNGPFSTILSTAKPSESTPTPITDVTMVQKSELVKVNTRLATLYRLSDLLRDANNKKTILERVMNLLFEVLSADRGVILLCDPDTGRDFQPAIVKYRHDEPITQQSIAISRTIIQRSADEKIAILSRDARTDDRFKNSESIMMHDIRSALCVPLIAKSRVMGVLHVDTRESVRAFNEADLSFISSLSNELAMSLENLEMRDRMVQQEKMAAIGQTITSVAHNIKNILQLTRGGVQLMDKSLDSGSLKDAKASWKIVKKGEEKIGRFIKDMLDFSRSTTGPRTPKNINDVVREIADSVKDDLSNKSIDLELDLDDGIPERRISEDGMYKSLMNLIINASEAITHDEGKITLSTSQKSNGDVIIKVADNGDGIPEEYLKKLFVPFFTTKGSNGTGLGLCTTKKIIEDNNGKISVKSDTGLGTTFIITLFSEDTKIGE